MRKQVHGCAQGVGTMKQPPHPLISGGDPAADDWDSLHVEVPEYIEKRVEAIFSAATANSPKETKGTHMMGGSGRGFGNTKRTVIRWVPQNKRFYFAFDKIGFSKSPLSTHTPQKLGGMGVPLTYDYKMSEFNSGAEVRVEGFAGCDFRIKKSQIEVLPVDMLNVSHEFVVVEHGDALAYMSAVMDRMQAFAKRVAYALTLVHGGALGKLLKVTHGDDAISGDLFIDSLPPESRFQAEKVKKVYPFKTEFKGHEAAGVYLSNAAVDRVAPLIAAELRDVSSQIRLIGQDRRAAGAIDYLFARADVWNGLSVREQDVFLFESFGVRPVR